MSQGIIDVLINELTRLPGIGRKSAQRLAFHILTVSSQEARQLAQAIIDVKERAGFCKECFNVTDSDKCGICSDPSRDGRKICVVEEPGNVIVIERTRAFNGLYHVLLGALSPIDGVTADKLKINELIDRIKSVETEGAPLEIIIATNPNTKGEMTAHYIADRLRHLNVTVSRIAYGLPMGGDIEFADEVTLTKSLEGRRKL